MTVYPIDDLEFEDHKIQEVLREHTGYDVHFESGFNFWCPLETPVKPMPGRTARFYGKGFGYPVRGLFIEGEKVFYRTAAEDEDYRLNGRYGASAADWLARWDAGAIVWSLEMGGLGPGYEQCIQITAAEVLRMLLEYQYTNEELKENWDRTQKCLHTQGMENPVIKALDLSGAQWGAAVQLATGLFVQTPRGLLTKPEYKDRQIQVSKNFPNPYE